MNLGRYVYEGAFASGVKKVKLLSLFSLAFTSIGGPLLVIGDGAATAMQWGMAGAVDVELSPGPEPSGSESEPEGFAIDLPIKKLDVAHAAKVSCFIVDEGIRDECCAAPAPA